MAGKVLLNYTKNIANGDDMSIAVSNPENKSASKLEIEYPSSDGQPMAENTEHYQWIVTIIGGLEVGC